MSNSAKPFPTWTLLLLATNCILLLAIILLIWQQQGMTAFFGKIPPVQIQPTPELGSRHKLNYQQWVDILKQEAKVVAQKPPEDLIVLAGDSLSLWFPPELLPQNNYWLNQGISGETTGGLLKRLDLFDQTQPDAIFVMIGINDLLRGESDEVILNNLRQIMRYLRKIHPGTRIVIQSILPHGGEKSTWEGREKLLAIPNSRIQELNQQLQKIARKEKIKYLNLYSLFTDKQGNLRSDLTTDGLHLDSQGYLVWSSALQLYNQLEKEKN